ncbi:MAG TPA: hypothetical protein VF268_08590 [Gammaproteobacteria bacterium]|jgi:hypothetical protein
MKRLLTISMLVFSLFLLGCDDDDPDCVTGVAGCASDQYSCSAADNCYSTQSACSSSGEC